MFKTQRRILIITGPTASGKTALGIEAAHLLDGVVINADAMQVYKGLEVITASPSDEEKAQAPHRLFNYRNPAQPCSVAEWIAAARIAIYETFQQGKTPILVGGTGMYIKSLAHGIAEIPDISGNVREATRALATEEAYARLATKDPEMAARLNAGDRQRVLRALEVVEHTGKSLLYFQSLPPEMPVPDADFRIIALTPDRAMLYTRCDARLERMLEQGALEEVQAMLNLGLSPDLPAMRAVGVPELAAYLHGEITKEQALGKAQQATRNYAKRQMTWIRHQFKEATPLPHPYPPLKDVLKSL